jgi:hypothetical protein
MGEKIFYFKKFTFFFFFTLICFFNFLIFTDKNSVYIIWYLDITLLFVSAEELNSVES